MVTIKVPEISGDISKVKLTRWFKANGQFVRMDETLAELETDKAVFELTAETPGILTCIAQEGDWVKVGGILATLEENTLKASRILSAELSGGKTIHFHHFTGSDESDILLMMEAFYAIDNYPFDAESSHMNLNEFTSNPNLGRLFLIKEDLENIGYIILTFGYSFEYQGKDAFIDEFFIKKEFRGMGIGNLTMDFIENEATKLGIKAIHLEVEAHNEQARKLYLNQGFSFNSRTLLTKKTKDLEG